MPEEWVILLVIVCAAIMLAPFLVMRPKPPENPHPDAGEAKAAPKQSEPDPDWDYDASLCTICNHPIAGPAAALVCKKCGTPFHGDCVAFNDSVCAVYGCGSKNFRPLTKEPKGGMPC